MNKVFKFRGWNKEEGKMYYNVQNAYDYLGEIPAISFGGIVISEDWVVMQFTGLIDKNGKDIYEGDIVKYPEFYNGDYRKKAGVGIIEFIDATFCLVDKNGEYLSELIPDHIYYEVIGNIYENKELLENDS